MMEITELKKILNTKSRLIGVDMGTKKVGISISDENRKIATPLKTIDYKNIQYLGNEIQKIVKDSGIDAIIFGNPLNMDGSKGSAAQSIKDKIICLKLKLIILLKDLLSFLGFLEYSVGEVILFKNKPSNETISKMKRFKWQYKKLPENPYL